MSSSTSSSSSEEDAREMNYATPPPPKRCKKYQKRIQCYRKEWESTFKWVNPDKSSKNKAYCNVCNRNMDSELYILKAHSESKRHISRLNAKRTQTNVLSKFVCPIKSDNVSVAEIKLAGFFAEHNLSFSIVDHLVPLLKEIAPDSAIIKDMQVGRTKLTALVKNVVGLQHKNELVEKLKNSKFSILTDESTDISCEKTSCIVVRYYDSTTCSIRSSLWELVQVFSNNNVQDIQGATAQHLYSVILESFEKHKIPFENVIGFASDGCNVMMGKNNSVASRFIENFPGIVIMKCVCHSAHLCASEACKQLPRRCEDLARNIYNHFKSSSKRQHELQQFQTFLNLEIHKILHPSQTRWLSLNEVVKRIIEQWDSLKLYFTSVWMGDRLVLQNKYSMALMILL